MSVEEEKPVPVAMSRPLEELLQHAQADPDILAVLLFGSVARGEHTATSDVDVCLVLQAQQYSPLALSRKKLAYRQDTLDVHVFQQLPLYIRRRVFKDGQVLWVKDTDTLYALACRTAQAFEDFKPLYVMYLAEVARAGP